ncbi:hypothetical protein CRUP_018271 [Coryphaenoides rupestris]|nr:hypothetical protein CRUP_018271 [Coryphaenoides rupestris]
MCVNTFQNLATHQEKFHRDMGKLSQNLNDVMTKLDQQRQDKKGGTATSKAGDAGSRLSLTPSSGPDDYDSRALEYGDTVTSPTRAPQQEQPSADQEKQEEETQLHRHHPYAQESHGGWGDEDRNDGGDGGGGVEAPQSWDDTEGVHYEGARVDDPSYARPGRDDDVDGTREDWGEAGGVQVGVSGTWTGTGSTPPPRRTTTQLRQGGIRRIQRLKSNQVNFICIAPFTFPFTERSTG